MIGTIHFLNESSRRRGSGPSKFKPRLTRGSTRYRIMFKDREPACGVTTKWKRLRKKKLRVVGSARPTKRGKWTSAEDEALILATSFGPHVDHPSGHGHGGLSDARVIREGPTTADVYIDISPFYGMAPATVSGYRSSGRRYA